MMKANEDAESIWRFIVKSELGFLKKLGCDREAPALRGPKGLSQSDKIKRQGVGCDAQGEPGAHADEGSAQRPFRLRVGVGFNPRAAHGSSRVLVTAA